MIQEGYSATARGRLAAVGTAAEPIVTAKPLDVDLVHAIL